MTEIILGAVVIGLLVEIGYLTNSHKNEVDKLTRAIISKNLTELDTSTIIEKDKPKQEEIKEPDLIPLEEADNNLFIKAIKQAKK
jgi:hypothetical protein